LSAKTTLIVQKHAKSKLLPFNKKLFASWKLCYCAYFLRQKMLMHKFFFLTQNIVDQFMLNCRVGTLEYIRELRVAV